jgi:hypothetical protein
MKTKTLTKEELAKKLNKRIYPFELSKKLEDIAKENNLVVIHGTHLSNDIEIEDDSIIIKGAIDEELDFGEQILITKDGLFKNECDDEYCPYFLKIQKEAIKNKIVIEIKSYFGGEDLDPAFYKSIGKPIFCFTLDDRHSEKIATFDIFYDDDFEEYYCRGIILDLDELFPD